MCAIFGVLELQSDATADRGPVMRMGEKLRHRGPDDDGLMQDGPVVLGHRRLSIIDLSERGRQPMSNEDGTVWITYNGEIYNFAEFTDDLKAKGHRIKSSTDTEILVHLYEEHGIDFLSKINGMFAFALWDKKKNEFFLVRDRLGIKPLHYAVLPDRLIFASEIKGILQHPDVRRDLDHDALSEYLSYEYVPAPKTLFRGIRKLLPGQFLHVKDGQIKEHQFWTVNYESEKPSDLSEQAYAEELHRLLGQSVKRRLVADVPLGAFLSGGVDSSAICSLMHEFAPGKIETFNISFDDPSFDESAFSKQVSDYLGTRHHVRRLDPKTALGMIPDMMEHLDEPLGDASFIPTLLLSQFTREHVKVSLSGDGGDELFAGYPTYQAHRISPVFQRLPAWIQMALAKAVERLPVSDDNFSLDFKLKRLCMALGESSPVRRNYAWMGAFLADDKSALFSDDINASLQSHDAYRIAEKYFDSCSADDDLEKILYCDRRFYLQDDILVKVDRASMAASLEARVPFLDHEVVQFAARLPVQMKLNHFTTKYILKKAMKGRLPARIPARGKKGFGIPLAKWFKKELKPLLLDMFERSRLKRAGLFNSEYVDKLLNEHFENKKDHRKQIYTLLSFELWYEKYMGSGVAVNGV